MKLYSCCSHCMGEHHLDDEYDAHDSPCTRPGCDEGRKVTHIDESGPRDNDEHADQESP